MKSRRWWDGPRLQQWRYMTACGDYFEPFFLFPYIMPATIHTAESKRSEGQGEPGA